VNLRASRSDSEGDPVADTAAALSLPALVPTRRARFRTAVGRLAERSSAADLVRWMLLPAGILVLLGFALMVFGWYGASHTAREIEQIPYLISGGLIGLGLVVIGGLLLSATFYVAVLRKILTEQDDRDRDRS
jgi:hypothetical protein